MRGSVLGRSDARIVPPSSEDQLALQKASRVVSISERS
jgi:hypothetical protein